MFYTVSKSSQLIRAFTIYSIVFTVCSWSKTWCSWRVCSTKWTACARLRLALAAVATRRKRRASRRRSTLRRPRVRIWCHSCGRWTAWRASSSSLIRLSSLVYVHTFSYSYTVRTNKKALVQHLLDAFWSVNGCECILLLCARSLRVLRGVQRASVFKLVGALALELSPARLSQPALLRQLLLAVTRHVCTHATFATDGGDATDDVTTSANDGAGTRRMRLYNCLDIYVIGIYILISSLCSYSCTCTVFSGSNGCRTTSARPAATTSRYRPLHSLLLADWAAHICPESQSKAANRAARMFHIINTCSCDYVMIHS